MLTKDLLISFCEKNDDYKEKFCHIIDSEILNANDCDNILEYLCEFLMNPRCTNDVADCFPQILPALMLRAIPAIERQEAPTDHQDLIHRLNCVILGQLFVRNHNLFTYTLRYFDHNPAPFEPIVAPVSIPSSKKRKVAKMSPTTEVTDYDIVVASYNILRAATSHFRHKWDWSKMFKYARHPDDKVKWYAIKCIGIILEMSEPLRIACAKSMLTDYDKFMIDYDENTIQTESSLEEFTPSNNIIDGVSSVVSIGNVLLPVIGESSKDLCNLVPVPSMEENLRSLAVAVASKKCICLQGAVGCGKTALVEYLAQVTGHNSSNFVKVQLGDQTDSKMLLGMYRCTDIPGEFVWQPGVLTEAVTTGKWLLLEDIDSAALDVASILSNLIETGTLSVPGYRDTIYAKTGFQLFVTQRLIPSATGLQRQASGALNLLEKHWLSINVEPLSKTELITVIQTLFPVLSTVATRMVDVYLLFSMGFHEDDNGTFDGHLRTGRQTSTRDLIKWCSRSIIDFDVSSPDSGLKLFQDALDVFCYSVPDQAHRLKLAIAVAHKLGIVKTKAEFFCNMYKPSVSLLPEFFVAGRAKLPRKMAQFASLSQEKTKFSFTRPSACLLEHITSCIVQKEPVLLVGETGTGKTSAVQYLARSTGHKLVVINMNQQSESADLLGGYKPVDFKFLVSPIREEFEIMFRTYFALEPNRKFLDYVTTCYKQQKWSTLVKLMNHSTLAAVKRLKSHVKEDAENNPSIKESNESQKRKHREPVPDCSDTEQLRKWNRLATKLQKLESQVKTQYSLAFAFIEGTLIKALRDGHWVLLDEINLANAETLECLSGLLERSSGSLSLLERGDRECVKRHKDFTIFACMNPATDVGKRDLPVGLRNRFTEFYVDELTAHSDLELLVNSYLKELNLPVQKHEAIVKFYSNIRKQATTTLFDGTAHKPLYSLRTLCRALNVSAANPCGNVLRSLYEAFSLSFLTQLDYNSYPIVQKLIGQAVLDSKTQKAILGSPIPKPRCGPDEDYISFEGYWVVKGSLEPETPKNYILTQSVRRNLKDLVRVVSIGKIPILLQGDTSVGKTSLITYLAKASGHVCMRINNHEHTDLQEYVGNYVADSNGKLVFQEGVLVEAMRKGYWIILDELNLAPSDVLEALNRVLDDNRELYIPETQQTVKAHENFMLFATQNPPGLYGGRKVLSRAFRNRFVELHFDEIPASELQVILHERCSMPETYCKQIIAVMTDLQIRRKSTAAFAGKQGFITLRDLFRWGERYRLAPDMGEKLYDWHQHLADEGYLVLSAKVRKAEEADEIRQVIKKHMKRDVDPDKLFTLNGETSTVTRSILEELLNSANMRFKHIVWTYHMRRMAVLVKKSCQFKEPVLLVGETGGGKTTVCQLIAAINNQNMHCVNCHMHTESSDFLGNLRPVREHNAEGAQKLFEWVDGPLISAMRHGDLFLADEISLADDSVLERLNSLLEPERNLLLAERGCEAINGNEIENVIVANEKFIFIGTMNPGGDYGKRELSPALRNRFTEVWCEGCMVMDDLRAIIEHNVHVSLRPLKESVARAMLNFVEWLPTTEIGKKFVVSIRDVLTWVNFVNTCMEDNERGKLNIGDAYYHGACLTYIDSLGSGLTGSENAARLREFQSAAIACIEAQIKDVLRSQLSTDDSMEVDKVMITNTDDVFGISPFYIEKGDHHACTDQSFTFSTPTTSSNTLKLLRALQLKKPILLEGSPGVGKTSLVSALAKASGYTLLRINLSDQTDVSDLFGADLPVEGGKSGQFAWKDGPFLRALRAGHWILLDELNLASQSVLEGLNACFDHRGEVYIPELGKSFSVKPGTRLFGCQNPLRQGGSRRGLPKSFLNRFTQVFVDALAEEDLELILSNQFPQLQPHLVQKMVKFNSKIAGEAGLCWGFIGSPWELNLRDITRWCESMIRAAESQDNSGELPYNPGCSVDLIYAYRMRTEEDREKVRQIYQEMFPGQKYPRPPARLPAHITEDKLYVGDVSLSRTNSAIYTDCNLLLLRDQKVLLRSLMQCVELNWMSILVGGSGCGKSSLVRLLASLVGQKLRTIAVNSAMDTTEILGGFEQTDYNRHLEQLFERTENLVVRCLRGKIKRDNLEQMAEYHGMLEKVRHMSDDEDDVARTMLAETKLFLKRIEELLKLVVAVRAFEPAEQSELDEIEDKLKKLAKYVKQDRCLNAGGKFEWIDSVLVKCLRDGTWLLIDQVNLCNAAVLDRLNGLLEPNGVLSIGERGVDGEGNVVTIKPHKNFRLFLTMDPRYGEISRAMRNRGVEIYLLGPKESAAYNDLDLRSMLHSVGITSHVQQSILLDIHRLLAQELISVERLTVVELIHSAFLARQQILCGFPTRQSIRTGCVDVYIKAKSVRDPRLKDRFISIIEEALERLLSSADDSLTRFDLNAATWSIEKLQDNRKLAIVRQHGLLLSLAIRSQKPGTCLGIPSVQVSTTAFINQFLGLDAGDEPILDARLDEILPYFLLDFYELSSRNDVEVRRRWLSWISAGGGSTEVGELVDKSADLSREIASFHFRSAKDFLPWDLTQLSNVSQSLTEDNVCDANRLGLILYLRAMLGVHDDPLADSVPKKDEVTMSVRQYSNAIYHEKLSAQLKNQPLITEYVSFVAQVRKTMDSLLRDSNLSISTSKYVEFRNGMQWFARYRKLGEMTLVNKAQKSRDSFPRLDEVSLLLRVHYKWLCKFIRSLLAVYIREGPLEDVAKLTAMMRDFDDKLISVHDPFRKLSKMLKKYLTLPLPHTSEESMEIDLRLKKLSNVFNPWLQDAHSLKQELKLLYIGLNDNLSQRHKVISLWNDVYYQQIFDHKVLDTVSEVEDFSQQHHLALNTPTQEAEVLRKINAIPDREIKNMSAKIQLWPVYEYLFMLYSRNLQTNLCEGRSANPVNMSAMAKFASVPSIPIDIIGILSAASKHSDDSNRKLLLLPELFVWLEKFSEQSYAFRNPGLLLHFDGITERDLEASITSYENVSSEHRHFFDGPTLVHLILELMLNRVKHSNDPLSASNLGSHAARANQLKCLNEILWRNSVTLTSDRYSFRNNDLTTLKFYLNLYLSAIQKMNSDHDTRTVMDNLIKAQTRYDKTELERKFNSWYVEPVEELERISKKLESGNENDAMMRGKCWMLLGSVQMLFFGNLGYIDPVQKVGLKLSYLEEDVADYKKLIYVSELQSRILGTGLRDENRPTRISEVDDRLEGLAREMESVKSLKAFRPPSADFVALAKEADNFRNSVCTHEILCKHVEGLTDAMNNLCKNSSGASLKAAEEALQEAETWKCSVQRFSEQLEAKYLAGYPDMVLPLLSALNQIKHGACIMANEVRRALSLAKIGLEASTMNSLIYNLARYPTIGKQQESIRNLISLCTSADMKAMIGKTLSAEDRFLVLKEQFKMLKCGLCELYNYVSLNRELTQDLWRDLNALLHQVVMLWKQQEDENEKRKAEKESLYKNKAEICGKVLSEDEQIAVELRNLFPTYRDEDFGDVDDKDNPSLEGNNLRKQSADTGTSFSYSGLIAEEDITEIQEIHSSIVTSFITSSWLNCNVNNSPNYVQPLIQRYHAVGLLLNDVSSSLDEGLSAKLYNTLNFLTTLVSDSNGKGEIQRNFSVGSRGAMVYDYYRDPNVEEAKRCIPLLDTILTRINHLLEEWPEHPTLRSIRLIIDRIYGFPVTSSVSRFLTGLELLLVKMHQWEENAHSGVSLLDYTLQLTQQIISWRQLELACWKDCLNTAQQKLKRQASKWWFHLYSLVEGYLLNSADTDVGTADSAEDGQGTITKKKLIESLERFINESSLIEFEARLNLLRTFHCHVYYFDSSARKNELLAILWNLYNYYKQFVNDVNTKIASLKSPVEKKLRDFVKIARWNDISYWAVKETVEKTHRTLHKFTKEFENSLRQSASSCLAVRPDAYNAEASKGIWDDQAQTEYLINPADFTVSKTGKPFSMKDTFTKCELLSRADALLAKAKHLCKEVILMSSYPCIRIELETFIQDFMEHSARLRNQEVDRTQTKEKQKSQAKYILQQKKLALANYFKTLRRMGVSYRTGNLTWKNDFDKVVDFAILPLDLSGVSQYFTIKETDEQMSVQWSGCEKYYYKSVIKLNALGTVLKSNRTDIGPQNAERCLGFSAHIMLMANKQKEALAELFDYLVSLRMQVSNLSQMKEDNLNIPRQRDLKESSTNLKELLITLETGFEQLDLYLQCCPEEASSDAGTDDVLVLDNNLLPIQSARQGSEIWQNTKSLIGECLSTVKAMIKRYDTVFAFKKMFSVSSSHAVFFTSKHFSFLKDCHAKLQDLSLRVKDLSNVFGRTDIVHPMLDSVEFLQTQINENVRNFDKLQQVSEDELETVSDEIESYEKNVEALINNILLVIQKKYKENMLANEDLPRIPTATNDETETDADNEKEQISKNRFKEELVESLQKDVKNLLIEKICKGLNSLLFAMQEFDTKRSKYCSRLLLRCIPLLQQYTLLVQYYLNEKVASFRITCKILYLQLNVFLDLATNGFCVPKDLDVEEGDGDQMQDSKSQGGMGLGDGEGQKDVSDRIESEDQLEDARPANEEKEKPEDKDCREEEQGIEMSEDFDSKLQDMEKDENDEEDDKDDEDELDKEMGETSEGADKLDKEIWGEDKEESGEENDKSEEKDEGEGQGEETGEKEMGAKDDKNKRNDEKDDNTERERQEEERKEINEMDEPETNEDQIDPYHGTNQPPPEPEALDLPDDLNLDDDDGKEEQEGNEENPFDVDEMKETRPPPEKDEEETNKPEEDKQKEADQAEDSSDEEEDGEKVRNEPQKEDSVEDEPANETEDKAQGEDTKENEKEDEDRDKEEDKEGEEEKAAPSVNDASKQTDASEELDNTEGSKDKVAQQESQNEEQQEVPTENNQDDSSNKGTGQAQSEEQNSGHTGSSAQKNVPIAEQENVQKEIEKRKNPGKSDENRSLVDNVEPERKKLKIMHSKNESKQDEEEDSENSERKKTEMCEHIKNSEKFDDVAMDAATEEQVKQQASNMETEQEEQEKESDSVEINLHEDDEKNEEEDVDAPKQQSEKLEKSKSDKPRKDAADRDEDPEECQVEGAVVVEGDVLKTSTVERGNESAYYTRLTDTEDATLTPKQIERQRFEIEKILSAWSNVPSTQEASAAWNILSSVTDTAARDLSEKLRLVLEPTQASRLKGDYKTGRRINMRKIIPYIASEFRKDKIWLRRTKPSKRDYQIVLAIDDSSSMADNHSKELAFESLSLISKAMTYLEAGQLGVISFGEEVNVLHPLGEAFTEQSGARLMQEMQFEQKKTMVGQLVDFTVDMFEGRSGSSDNAKLLVVLSDGRGIFSEGVDKVNYAIRRARLTDIFLVFIIVENPTNKDSILDIRMPIFESGKLKGIRSYMDSFPFPFYMILRDINMLPGVLSDALRQWFEIVGKIDT